MKVIIIKGEAAGLKVATKTIRDNSDVGVKNRITGKPVSAQARIGGTVSLLLFLVIFASAGIFLGGCAPKEQPKKIKWESVRVVKAERGFIDEAIKTTGDVVAVNTVILRAAVEGPIEYCPWREGDKVIKGQKLIGIHRPLYEKELDLANAELEVKRAILKDLQFGPRPEEISVTKNELTYWENSAKFAKIDLDRLTLLAEKKVVSTQEQEKAYVNYEKSRSQYEVTKEKLKMLEEGTKKTELMIAQAQEKKAATNVELAQAKVDECTISAPFSGVITDVFVRPGDLTHLSSPRMPLVKIMHADSLIIRAGLPESSTVDITVGTKVAVELDAYPDKKLNAVIERIYPRLEWGSRTQIIEARITDKVKLIPRMFARISVQGRKFDNAILVPDSAIITTPRGHQVVFVMQDGLAKMKEVKVGLEKGHLVQIISGVDEGDMVITAGNLNLKDGVPVKPASETAKPAGIAK